MGLRATYQAAFDPPFVLRPCSMVERVLRCPQRPGSALDFLLLLQYRFAIDSLATERDIGSKANGSWSGILGQIATGRSDITAPQMMMNEERSRDVTLIPVFYGLPFCFFHCATGVSRNADLELGNPVITGSILLFTMILALLPIFTSMLSRSVSPWTFKPLQLGNGIVLPFKPLIISPFTTSYNLFLCTAFFFLVSVILTASISSESITKALFNGITTAEQLGASVQRRKVQLVFAEKGGAEYAYFTHCKTCGYEPIQNALATQEPSFEPNRHLTTERIESGEWLFSYSTGLAGQYLKARATTRGRTCRCDAYGRAASEITGLAIPKLNKKLSRQVTTITAMLFDGGILNHIQSKYMSRRKPHQVKQSTAVTLHAMRKLFIGCLMLCLVALLLHCLPVWRKHSPATVGTTTDTHDG